jgi:Caspase recruitment domain
MYTIRGKVPMCELSTVNRQNASGIALFVSGLIDETTTASQLQNVRINRADLEQKYMDPRFGLIDHLIASGFLDDKEAEIVSAEENKPIKQNELIIDCLLNKPPTELERFKAALIESNQQHVVNLIKYGKGKVSSSCIYSVVYSVLLFPDIC